MHSSFGTIKSGINVLYLGGDCRNWNEGRNPANCLPQPLVPSLRVCLPERMSPFSDCTPSTNSHRDWSEEVTPPCNSHIIRPWQVLSLTSIGVSQTRTFSDLCRHILPSRVTPTHEGRWNGRSGHLRANRFTKDRVPAWKDNAPLTALLIRPSERHRQFKER